MNREYFVGQSVRSADGHKLGTIARREGDTLVIEKGVFFKKEYLVRDDQIAEVRGDEIWLREQSAQLAESAERREGRFSGEARATGRAAEEARIGVREEELEVNKRLGEVGRVNVRKEVVTERRDISVPVMKEDVRVERVPVEASRASEIGDRPFQEESISVPIREEEVEIRKRPVVKEEIRVMKDQRVEQRAASEEVRKEVVHVDEEGRAGRVREESERILSEPGRDPDKY